MGKTLGQVLTKNNVPTSAFTRSQLNETVDSASFETIGDLVVLVYPTTNGHGILTQPLHVVRYDRVKNTVAQNRLSAPQVSEECFGSVLGIERRAANFLNYYSYQSFCLMHSRVR